MKLEERGRPADAARRYVDALRRDPSLADARARLEESGRAGRGAVPEGVRRRLRRRRPRRRGGVAAAAGRPSARRGGGGRGAGRAGGLPAAPPRRAGRGDRRAPSTRASSWRSPGATATRWAGWSAWPAGSRPPCSGARWTRRGWTPTPGGWRPRPPPGATAARTRWRSAPSRRWAASSPASSGWWRRSSTRWTRGRCGWPCSPSPRRATRSGRSPPRSCATWRTSLEAGAWARPPAFVEMRRAARRAPRGPALRPGRPGLHLRGRAPGPRRGRRPGGDAGGGQRGDHGAGSRPRAPRRAHPLRRRHGVRGALRPARGVDAGALRGGVGGRQAHRVARLRGATGLALLSRGASTQATGASCCCRTTPAACSTPAAATTPAPT